MKGIYHKIALIQILALSCIVFTSHLHGEESIAKTEIEEDAGIIYFPEQYVMETLHRYHVPQNQWDPIVYKLKQKEGEVLQTVEELAARMNPNPLQDPKLRNVAVKLYRQTLYDIFADVLSKHGVEDPHKIQSMLDDLQRQKAKEFVKSLSNT